MANSEINNAMSALSHGVYVLGVHTPEQDNLMTAAWLCQVSGSPAMLAVAVSDGHLTADMIRSAGRFTVSVLSEAQKDIAIACGTVSGRKEDKISRVDTEYTKSGIPMISRSIAQLECKVVDINTATGNHTIFIAEVIDAFAGDNGKAPLLYHAKDFF